MTSIFRILLVSSFSLCLLAACNSHSNNSEQENKDSVSTKTDTNGSTHAITDTAMNQTTGGAPATSAPQSSEQNNSSNPNMSTGPGSSDNTTALDPAAHGGTRQPNTYKSGNPGGQYMKANGADRSGGKTTGDNSNSAGSSTSQSSTTTGK